MEALRAAVASGADAVYLGGGDFNARRSAANFSAAELADAVLFAHRHGVRVYVTVNTLILQSEVSALADFLATVHASGADALIVQDPGVALLARELSPGMEIHASTQMTIHSTAQAAFWRRAGFDRIVLARELSLAEIGKIRAEAAIPVEVFAHGALCISYSGQCLFSSLIGGRSGNRGVCAQPCRLPYQLVGPDRQPLPTDEGVHLLSTRDLNLSDCLPDLVQAGVDGLKIEGRLRRPAYVATVTRIYRQLLDRLPQGVGPVEPEMARELTQVFNRDFTTGYLYGRPGSNLMSRQRPNNRGLPVGRIVNYDREHSLARVRLTAPLAKGDALAVWVSRGGRVTIQVEEIMIGERLVTEAFADSEVQLAVPAPVQSGDRVFKTLDAALMARADFPAMADEIPLSMTVDLIQDQPVRLTVTDPQGHTGTAVSAVAAVPAINQPLTDDVLRRQLGRLGNTVYRLASLDIRGPLNLMVPVSQLNILRRTALSDLERRAWGTRPPIDGGNVLARLLSERGPKSGPKVRWPALAVAVTGVPALEAALEAGASMVYLSDELGGRLLSPQILRQARDLSHRHGATVVPATPLIAHDAEYPRLREVFAACRELGLDTVLAGNTGSLALAKEYGLKVWGDFTLPAFNSLSLDFWQKSGVGGMTLSPELNLGQVRELVGLSPLPLEGLVHGALPLMVSAHCPLGTADGAKGYPPRRVSPDCSGRCRAGRWWLKDRKDELFEMVADRMCRMHLFNGRDLSMYSHLMELAAVPLRLWRIEARSRDSGYVATVTAIYRSALDRLMADRDPVEPRDQAVLAGLSPAGLTGAHYYRGVR